MILPDFPYSQVLSSSSLEFRAGRSFVADRRFVGADCEELSSNGGIHGGVEGSFEEDSQEDYLEIERKLEIEGFSKLDAEFGIGIEIVFSLMELFLLILLLLELFLLIYFATVIVAFYFVLVDRSPPSSWLEKLVL